MAEIGFREFFRDLEPAPWIDCECGIGYIVSQADRERGYTLCGGRYGCGKKIEHPKETHG